MQFPFQFKIKAPCKAAATRKAKALAKLGSKFDPDLLEALANKGDQFIYHPVYGHTIRTKLGLE